VRLSVRRYTNGLSTKGGVWEPESKAHRACAAATEFVYESGEKYLDGCDAAVNLGIEIPLRIRTEPDGYQVMLEVPRAKRIAVADPRWPEVCAKCGEPFKRGDHRQWNQAEVYVRGDNGEEVAFRGYADKSMAGALYDAWWLHERRVVDAQGVERRYVGPDGIALVAICPNGLAWEVDGPASGGGGWARTGDPRHPETLSVSPSIIAGKPGAPGTYHGFLQSGSFTAHVG
jgi:hypothetical protein